jgi:hypothetical protein
LFLKLSQSKANSLFKKYLAKLSKEEADSTTAVALDEDAIGQRNNGFSEHSRSQLLTSSDIRKALKAIESSKALKKSVNSSQNSGSCSCSSTDRLQPAPSQVSSGR